MLGRGVSRQDLSNDDEAGRKMDNPRRSWPIEKYGRQLLGVSFAAVVALGGVAAVGAVSASESQSEASPGVEGGNPDVRPDVDAVPVGDGRTAAPPATSPPRTTQPPPVTTTQPPPVTTTQPPPVTTTKTTPPRTTTKPPPVTTTKTTPPRTTKTTPPRTTTKPPVTTTKTTPAVPPTEPSEPPSSTPPVPPKDHPEKPEREFVTDTTDTAGTTDTTGTTDAPRVRGGAVPTARTRRRRVNDWRGPGEHRRERDRAGPVLDRPVGRGSGAVGPSPTSGGELTSSPRDSGLTGQDAVGSPRRNTR